MNLYAKTLLDVIKSVLNGQKLFLPEKIDNEVLVHYLDFHRMMIWLYEALLKEPEKYKVLLATLKEQYDRCLFLSASQDAYIELISTEFQKHNIRFALMKGSLLKHDYPSTELRESTDIDIYIFPDDFKRADGIIQGIGAEKLREETIHFTYRFGAQILIELHFLITEKGYPWSDECNAIADRLVRFDGTEYRMTYEDFYLHLIVHAARHFVDNEINIRNVLDIYLFLKKHGSEICHDNIKWKMSKTGLVEFEYAMRMLAIEWFGNINSDDNNELGRYILELYFTGIFGTKLNEEASRQNGNNKKIKMIISEMFPSYKTMCKKYPILNYIPLAIPFMWIYRIMYHLFFRRDILYYLYKTYGNINADTGNKVIELKRSLLKNFEGRG